VKLGTGGLSRAYSGGVVLALDSLPVDEKVDRETVDVTVGYTDVDAIQRLIGEYTLPIIEEDFGADVRYRLAIPIDEVEEVTRRIGDLTRGSGRIDRD
jgi:putative IMPACT (imprinted ancient) family translation regulator